MYRWPAVELGGALPPTDRLRLLANAGDVRMSQDMPDAEEAHRYVLDECRRLGDAGSGSAAANLALMWLFLGRWNEVLLLLEEALEAIPVADTVLTLALRAQLVHHAALIGDVESARGHLSALTDWEHSEDSQDRAAAEVYAGIAAVATGDDGEALARGGAGTRLALAELGVVSEYFRSGWPLAVDAAFRLGRLEDAAELVQLVADQPPGIVPPFVRAELDVFQGRLAAARTTVPPRRPRFGRRCGGSRSWTIRTGAGRPRRRATPDRADDRGGRADG